MKKFFLRYLLLTGLIILCGNSLFGVFLIDWGGGNFEVRYHLGEGNPNLNPSADPTMYERSRFTFRHIPGGVVELAVYVQQGGGTAPVRCFQKQDPAFYQLVLSCIDRACSLMVPSTGASTSTSTGATKTTSYLTSPGGVGFGQTTSANATFNEAISTSTTTTPATTSLFRLIVHYNIDVRNPDGSIKLGGIGLTPY